MQEKLTRFQNNLSLIMTAVRKKNRLFLSAENVRISFPNADKKVVGVNHF